VAQYLKMIPEWGIFSLMLVWVILKVLLPYIADRKGGGPKSETQAVSELESSVSDLRGIVETIAVQVEELHQAQVEAGIQKRIDEEVERRAGG